MFRIILKRLLQFVPVLFGITLMTFALMSIAPGDPATVRLAAGGVTPSPEQVAALQEEMGLNRPFLVQYLSWVSDFLQGDLGTSFISGLPVTDKLLGALPYSMLMASLSITLTLVVSIPLGILTAVRKDKFDDILIRLLTFVGNAVPNFTISIILMYIFALKLRWFPVLATRDPKGAVLPAIALAIVMSSRYIRQVRAAVLDELGKDYVVGARARGIKEKTILYKHVLKNIMVTVVTLTAISIGSLLAGTVVVETIFNWPGLGVMVMEAITTRDYPVIQGFVVWVAIAYMLVNLLADISYTWFNPKIKEI